MTREQWQRFIEDQVAHCGAVGETERPIETMVSRILHELTEQGRLARREAMRTGFCERHRVVALEGCPTCSAVAEALLARHQGDDQAVAQGLERAADELDGIGRTLRSTASTLRTRA